MRYQRPISTTTRTVHNTSKARIASVCWAERKAENITGLNIENIWLPQPERFSRKTNVDAVPAPIGKVHFRRAGLLIQQDFFSTSGQRAMVFHKSNQQEVPLSIRLRVQPIGEIAVQNGLLTTEQVVRVCDEQKDCKILFGELAKKMGFLTTEQLEFLIEAKQEHDRIVDEALTQCC